MPETVEAAAPAVCLICREPFRDGDDVVQVVEDRHPTYDHEVVRRTYHRSCFHVAETLMHGCARCGCMFHLALVRQGEAYRNLSLRLTCPFCGAPFESRMGC